MILASEPKSTSSPSTCKGKHKHDFTGFMDFMGVTWFLNIWSTFWGRVNHNPPPSQCCLFNVHRVDDVVECARKLVKACGHLPTEQSQPVLVAQHAFAIEPGCINMLPFNGNTITVAVLN